MEDYKQKATSPNQYDSPELDWTIDGDINAPSRVFFRKYLRENLERLDGKKVLDIGCGVGHVFPTLKEYGASDISGIEPSKRNVENVKRLYPDVKIFQTTLEDFNPEDKFDAVIAIMIFEHIYNIDEAFKKVFGLLKSNSNFYMITGDVEFHTKNHPGAEVNRQQVDEQTFATKTIRPTGTMYDLFRSMETYIKSAEAAGFEFKKHVGLVPTGERFIFFNGKPTCHLYIFHKN
jgi:2-polyprenyl-3-methyl-5-hydroxy-6-metoxy-1,4-benzoquinol methylase